MKKTLAIILSLALVICMMPAAAFAAEGDPTGETKLDVSGITVSIKNATAAYTGEVQTPELQFTGGNAASVTNEHYTVTSWSATGTSEVKNAGSYSATFSWNTEKTTATVENKDKTLTFEIKPIDLSTANISTTGDLLSSDFDADGAITESGKAKITVKAGNVDLKTGTLAEKVAISYAYAAANGNNPASVTVSVKSNGDANILNERQGSFPIKTDISSATVELARAENFTYNGSEQKPSYGVVVKLNGTTIPTSGYTVTYSNNVNGNTYGHATVEGIGMYSGKKTVTNLFYINPKSITASGVSIDVSTGTATKDPTVTIRDGENVLKKGTDYTVTFSGNVATITGTNNYTGTVTRNFTIVDKTIDSATVSTETIYYSGAAQEPSITVKDSDGYILTKNVDYKVTYTKDGKQVTPKDAGTYGIIVTGTGKYAGTIENRAFTINPYKKSWVEASASAGSTTSTPYVTLKSLDGKITFVKDKDYKVTNTSTSKYTGKVTVYIDTMGNIETGSLTATYALVAKSISSCSAYFTNGKSSSAYTGATISVPITVKDSYTVLTQGTDYTVTYKNASGKVVSYIKDAGTYTIEITGKGLYSGTTYLTYTVTGNDISGYTVTLKESSVMADGYVKVPVITSVALNSYTKLSSSDYTVSYQDADGKTVTSIKAPGTYKVIVTGAGKYSGSIYATFRVVGLSQSITGVESSYKVYPNDTLVLSPKATEGRFTYSSSDPSVATVSSAGVVTAYKAGRAKITITTTGNTKYDQVSKSTVIKVYPKKAVITKKPWTDGKKAQLKVRWNKQENVTRYEIRYSRAKNFKKGTYLTKKVNAANNDYTTQSTTIKNLKSGYTYYVKVRAVKEVYNDYGKKITYYGKWSGWRSVKVK